MLFWYSRLSVVFWWLKWDNRILVCFYCVPEWRFLHGHVHKAYLLQFCPNRHFFNQSTSTEFCSCCIKWLMTNLLFLLWKACLSCYIGSVLIFVLLVKNVRLEESWWQDWRSHGWCDFVSNSKHHVSKLALFTVPTQQHIISYCTMYSCSV